MDAQPLHHYQHHRKNHSTTRKGGVDHEHLVKTLMVHVQKVVATEVIVAEVQLDPALTAP